MAQADSQHLPSAYPDAVYPHEWTSDPKEDRAGYISLEKSEVYAETARGAFKLAGLDKVVKVRLISSFLSASLPVSRLAFNMHE